MKNVGLFAIGVVVGAGLLAFGLGIARDHERRNRSFNQLSRQIWVEQEMIRLQDEMEDHPNGPLPDTRRLVAICKKTGLIRRDDDVIETENYFLSHGVFGITPAGGRPELMIIHIDPCLEEATLVFSTGEVVDLPLRGSTKWIRPNGHLPR